jgi:hypothetical protein
MSDPTGPQINGPRFGRPKHLTIYGLDVATYVVSISLMIVAAWFSITGLVVLFPVCAAVVAAVGATLESTKLRTLAWLARGWRRMSRLLRAIRVIILNMLAGPGYMDGSQRCTTSSPTIAGPTRPSAPLPSDKCRKP